MIEPGKNEVQKSKLVFKYFYNFLIKLLLMEKVKRS